MDEYAEGADEATEPPLVAMPGFGPR
jgi:hypothetical protein